LLLLLLLCGMNADAKDCGAMNGGDMKAAIGIGIPG
jgi:hypothetical protein